MSSKKIVFQMTSAIGTALRGYGSVKWKKKILNFKLLDELFPIYKFSSVDFPALYLCEGAMKVVQE